MNGKLPVKLMKTAGIDLETKDNFALHSSGMLLKMETHMDQDLHATTMTTQTHAPWVLTLHLSLLLTKTMSKLSSVISLNNGALLTEEMKDPLMEIV